LPGEPWRNCYVESFNSRIRDECPNIHPDTIAATEAAGLKRDDKFWWAFKLYADGLPFNDPTLSPINASLAGLPPVHLNVGTQDFFLHDIRRLRDTLQTNNVPVTYIEQEHAEHVYALRSHTAQARWVVNDQIRWLHSILPTHNGGTT
jgi:acetyl esterase/lipase